MADAVAERAWAKTNLRLRVLAREESGFHGLETIFLRLDLADDVELVPGEEGIRLSVEGVGHREAGEAGEAGEGGGTDDDAAAVDPAGRVPGGAENLCWQAASLYHEAAGLEPAVSIRLRKRVPAGAGLGGGSADAAAVLRGLDRLTAGALPPEELVSLAGELGSDVPFALAGGAMALGWERGRRILPLPAPDPRPMLLVVPGLRVPTPSAYGWIDEAREDAGSAGEQAGGAGGGLRLPPPEELRSWDALADLQVNDFEEPVFRRHPELGWWKEELLGEGAELAFLSGSGSALCAVFREPRRRDAAGERVRASGEVGAIATRGPL